MTDRVVRDFVRPPPETIEKFRDMDVSTIYEASGKVGLMSSEIRPIDHGMRMVGPAFTVLVPAGDNLMQHKALSMAKTGDVLVVATRGPTGAVWGGLTTIQAMETGLSGFVTEGMVRDSAFIRRVKFPCFSRGIGSEGTSKKGPGSINVTVSCGGVLVSPGDIVIGDDDGVVVVPRRDGEETARKARERLEREGDIETLLKQGKTTFELLGLEDNYRKLGLPETEKE